MQSTLPFYPAIGSARIDSRQRVSRAVHVNVDAAAQPDRIPLHEAADGSIVPPPADVQKPNRRQGRIGTRQPEHIIRRNKPARVLRYVPVPQHVHQPARRLTSPWQRSSHKSSFPCDRARAHRPCIVLVSAALPPAGAVPGAAPKPARAPPLPPRQPGTERFCPTQARWHQSGQLRYPTEHHDQQRFQRRWAPHTLSGDGCPLNRIAYSR